MRSWEAQRAGCIERGVQDTGTGCTKVGTVAGGSVGTCKKGSVWNGDSVGCVPAAFPPAPRPRSEGTELAREVAKRLGAPVAKALCRGVTCRLVRDDLGERSGGTTCGRVVHVVDRLGGRAKRFSWQGCCDKTTEAPLAPAVAAGTTYLLTRVLSANDGSWAFAGATVDCSGAGGVESPRFCCSWFVRSCCISCCCCCICCTISCCWASSALCASENGGVEALEISGSAGRCPS